MLSKDEVRRNLIIPPANNLCNVSRRLQRRRQFEIQQENKLIYLHVFSLSSSPQSDEVS